MSNATRGRDTTIYFNGYRVSSFLNEWENEAEADDLEFTPFEAADKEYLTGTSENTTTLTGTFNGATASFDDLIDSSYAAGTLEQILICPAGIITPGRAGLMLGDASVQKQKASGKSDDINEYEVELRSKRNRAVILKTPVAVSATGNGSSVQAAAATDFGAIATVYLEAVGGTVPPTGIQFELEHSPDNTSFTTFGVAIATSLTVADVGRAYRYESDNTLTLEKYVRVKHTITGGTAPTVKYVCAMHRRLSTY